MDQTPLVPAQRSADSVIAARLDLWAVVCPGLRMHVPACLRYDPKDPYAVHLDHYIGQEEVVTWAFARDLLVAGLCTWAGTGDVSVYPGAGGAQNTFITFRGAVGETLLQADTADIRRFTRHTECLVPLGSERDHVDLDAVLLRLLGPPPADRP